MLNAQLEVFITSSVKHMLLSTTRSRHYQISAAHAESTTRSRHYQLSEAHAEAQLEVSITS